MRAAVAPQAKVADPAADQRGGDTSNGDDGAERQVRALKRDMSDAAEKRWHPDLEAAEGEGHHGETEGRGPEGGIAQKTQHRRAIRRFLDTIRGTARRFGNEHQ